MNYWLFKSEPGEWSWKQQTEEGTVGTEWDGIRNYQARNFMRDMKLGDLGFFYHSVDEKRMVGIVKVVKEAHPDSTDDTGKWECVDVAALITLINPVSLDMCKCDPRLKDMVLINNPRLSVQPVTRAEWEIVCEYAGLPRAP